MFECYRLSAFTRCLHFSTPLLSLRLLFGSRGRHLQKGGQPGRYPPFTALPLDLYDPFGINKKMSPELRARRLNMEVNNGRLAMFGIMGFLAADKVPGSVPALTEIARPYAGNVMIPFEGQFSLFG